MWERETSSGKVVESGDGSGKDARKATQRRKTNEQREEERKMRGNGEGLCLLEQEDARKYTKRI